MWAVRLVVGAGMLIGAQPGGGAAVEQPEAGAGRLSVGEARQNPQDRFREHVATHGHGGAPAGLESEDVFVERVLLQLLAVRYWVGLAQSDPGHARCADRLRWGRESLAVLLAEEVLARIGELERANAERLGRMLFLVQMELALETTFIPESCTLTEADLVRIGAQFDAPSEVWTPISTEGDDPEALPWPPQGGWPPGGVGGGTSGTDRILRELQRTLNYRTKLDALQSVELGFADPVLLRRPGGAFQVLEERGLGTFFDVTPPGWQVREQLDRSDQILLLDGALGRTGSGVTGGG